ncbi:hypothetical protein ABIB62_004226 [Mucilaginibacter sp. UYP25]|uniref:helix-turn-helix domain-containing protein n=1 Tax=unclassified Mucilaginibacter TaxID=2617802 RepID=UPI003397FA27
MELFTISESTLGRWVYDEEMPCRKRGKFIYCYKDEIDHWMKKRNINVKFDIDMLLTMQLKARKWSFDLKQSNDKTVDLSRFQKATINALLNRLNHEDFI